MYFITNRFILIVGEIYTYSWGNSPFYRRGAQNRTQNGINLPLKHKAVACGGSLLDADVVVVSPGRLTDARIIDIPDLVFNISRDYNGPGWPGNGG